MRQSGVIICIASFVSGIKIIIRENRLVANLWEHPLILVHPLHHLLELLARSLQQVGGVNLRIVRVATVFLDIVAQLLGEFCSRLASWSRVCELNALVE